MDFRSGKVVSLETAMSLRVGRRKFLTSSASCTSLLISASYKVLAAAMFLAPLTMNMPSGAR